MDVPDGVVIAGCSYSGKGNRISVFIFILFLLHVIRMFQSGGEREEMVFFFFLVGMEGVDTHDDAHSGNVEISTARGPLKL